MSAQDPISTSSTMQNVITKSEHIEIERFECEVENEQARENLNKRVRWKTDLYILPLLSSVHFLAQMGRSDLGNAKIAGMQEELNLTPKMYSNVASILLVGYIIFQLPATLMTRKIGAPFQFSCAMMIWGAVTLATIKVNKYAELMVVRLFVGFAESLINGVVFYLSFWYKYDELASRGCIFYSTVTLSGSMNGIIAYNIQEHLNGEWGWRAWRWIFFIEGLMPIGWAIVIFFFLPRDPEHLKFGFTSEEKQEVIARSRASHNTGESKIIWKLIPKLFAQPQYLCILLIECGSHFAQDSLGNFIPDIIQGMGYESQQAQLMSIIVYACAFISLLVAGFVSDRCQKRGIVILICSSIAALGYILLLAITNDQIRLFAACLVATGVYPILVIGMIWNANNNIGYTYRGASTASTNVLSQVFSISGNQAYGDPPYYHTGLSASLGMVIMCAVASLVLMWVVKTENAKKVVQQGSEEAAQLRTQSIDLIGNKHPDFFLKY